MGPHGWMSTTGPPGIASYVDGEHAAAVNQEVSTTTGTAPAPPPLFSSISLCCDNESTMGYQKLRSPRCENMSLLPPFYVFASFVMSKFLLLQWLRYFCVRVSSKNLTGAFSP
jgi:hypothetical protein